MTKSQLVCQRIQPGFAQNRFWIAIIYRCFQLICINYKSSPISPISISSRLFSDLFCMSDWRWGMGGGGVFVIWFRLYNIIFVRNNARYATSARTTVRGTREGQTFLRTDTPHQSDVAASVLGPSDPPSPLMLRSNATRAPHKEIILFWRGARPFVSTTVKITTLKYNKYTYTGNRQPYYNSVKYCAHIMYIRVSETRKYMYARRLREIGATAVVSFPPPPPPYTRLFSFPNDGRVFAPRVGDQGKTIALLLTSEIIIFMMIYCSSFR